MTIKDIKERRPNEKLINSIEKLLESAKSGELRSMFYVCGWDDCSVNHGWAYDLRSARRPLLAELVLLQHNYIIDTEFAENETVLAKRFEGWE